MKLSTEEAAIRVDPRVEDSETVVEKLPSEQFVESDWSSKQELKLRRK